MFVDDVKLVVKAGNGGNGAVSFRHEKYIAKGGPYGGDGGKGGSIIFVGDEGLTTLLDFKYKRKITAKNGENGMTKNCFGKDATDVYIKVPVGSVVYDLTNNIVIADITKHNQQAIIAKGGRGGRGNSSFATARIPAPEFAENGEPGEEKEIRIELKVLADVGLVGFPSVGKSTLISICSACKPKIADYHFTTLVPNLGVVQVKDGRSFVMADLPGLIEGASNGAGLGFQFLKHIERTRVIVHVIDMSGLEGRDPIVDYQKINNELETYNPKLMLRPQIVVANKMDLPSSKENLIKFKEKYPDLNVIAISAYTKDNLDALLYEIANELDKVSLDDFNETVKDEVVEYKFIPKEEPFRIEKTDEGLYNVVGPAIKRIFDSTDFNRDESVKMFAKRIRNLGVDKKLQELGVKAGETVLVLGYEFEFFN
ncbi:MAG: GTPase ObgE [Acholeplasmataceae bacterium]|nr:GTPase ObgE [Acholeplasmataceae bacterium]